MPTNFYMVFSIQRETEVDAIAAAARVASTVNETVEVRVCGTMRRIAVVTPKGDVGVLAGDKAEVVGR